MVLRDLFCLSTLPVNMFKLFISFLLTASGHGDNIQGVGSNKHYTRAINMTADNGKGNSMNPETLINSDIDALTTEELLELTAFVKANPITEGELAKVTETEEALTRIIATIPPELVEAPAWFIGEYLKQVRQYHDRTTGDGSGKVALSQSLEAISNRLNWVVALSRLETAQTIRQQQA